MNRPTRKRRLHCLAILLTTLCPRPAGAQPAFLVKDINTTPGESPASSISSFLLDYFFGEDFFLEHSGVLLFSAREENSFTASKLWRSDGTEAGTFPLSDALTVRDLTRGSGNTVFFAAEGSLFSTDGTSTGTMLISSSPAHPHGITAVGDFVFYLCSDPATGTELCRSDGTPEGSGLIKDILPGPDDSSPTLLTPMGNTLFFTARDEPTDRNLWKSDGTADGTVRVKDISPGSFALPERLTDVDGTLFFSAHTPETGRELWKSDGTEAGTVLVKDIHPGESSSFFDFAPEWRGYTAAMGGNLYFQADDGASGMELWKSDGTADGTVLVKDIAPGPQSSFPFWPASANGKIYFDAEDEVHGRELWGSDGTAAGTLMVADIFPGEGSSFPDFLVTVGHVVVFSASDGVHGREMWRSNGTPAGTRMIQDIAPGDLSSSPALFTPAGNYVFFAADDSIIGFEPWAVPLSAVLATFTDVPTDHWAWPFVEGLAASGLTGGCGAGRYCPDQAVTRAEAAVFVVRGVHGSHFVPPPATGAGFEDVPAGFWAAPWIEQLAADGLTRGCNLTPPLYCPERLLTRAEMAVFLLRAKHGNAYNPPPATGTVFTDVPVDYYGAPWIEQLAAEEITGGCAPGLYCPDNPVTRAEMAVFLTKTFSLPLP